MNIVNLERAKNTEISASCNCKKWKLSRSVGKRSVRVLDTHCSKKTNKIR